MRIIKIFLILATLFFSTSIIAEEFKESQESIDARHARSKALQQQAGDNQKEEAAASQENEAIDNDNNNRLNRTNQAIRRNHNQPIIKRCQSSKGKYGAASVKSCVDRDIEAEDALRRY